MSIFDHNPTTETYWVQCPLHVGKPPRRHTISIRLAYTPGFNDPDGEWVPGGYEIIDYRAPSLPFVTWQWIDAHQREIFSNLELNS